MTLIAPVLQRFFTDRLIGQRNASAHTVAAYRDTFRLLLTFASHDRGRSASQLRLDDLDPKVIAKFLDHLEIKRGNSVATRNARLAAIHSLFRYAALHHPDHAATIQQVLAIPPKRCARTIVTFLTESEIDAMLAAPNNTTWTGRRDYSLLVLAIQTGLRVSELIALTRQDVHLGSAPHVSCHGKGRKQRITPLTRRTVAVLRAWMTEHAAGPSDPLFVTRSGNPLSRDAIEHRVAHYAHTAERSCPSLASKKVTAHTLRHSAAMQLLHAGIDTSVIALWLGHEKVDTTQIYLHADLEIKQRALERTNQRDTRPGRYRAPDNLLAFLDAL
jgi:site-specific recombinase XerD